MTVLAVTPNQKVEFFPRRAPAFGEEQEFYVPGSLTIADIRTSERKESMSIKSIFEDMLIDEVRALRQLHQGWDSYNAPIPNERAIANASRVLELSDVQALMRARILPSAEGGIGIYFTNGDRYADLECLNDGDILGVRYIGNQAPTLVQADATESSILSALQEIKAHVFG